MCALVFINTVQEKPERQQQKSHTGEELTEHVWKWAATSRKALNSIKNGKEIQAKIKKMTKPLANKHSIKSQKTDVIWFIFLAISLWSSFCTQWPRADLWVASPRVCCVEWHVSLHLWLCFVHLQTRPVADVGCWWMVSDDGALHGVVGYSCWTAYGKENASPLKRMLYFHWGFSGWLWLAPSWFVSAVAVHVIFPFVCIWERTGELKKVAKARRKTACIRADTGKMPQKMTATCHTRPQARLHKNKTANISERQQEHKEPGAKILMNIVARTAGWRSSLSNGAGWISSLSNGAHWRMPNKRRRGPGAETSLQQPQHHSRRKLTLSNVLMLFLCWGCVRDTLARRMPYEMLVPRCKGILQRVNCHSIRALCAPSVLPCGSCRMVMDGSHLSLHLHTVISKEFCWRAFARSMLMSHSAMDGHKLVCFFFPLRVVLSFVVYFKALGN